jgi:HD superfamily phosphohydrolase
MSKARRIRDPVHDLIPFDTSRFEQMAWKLLELPEFQRLRRIKQLGFTELVFPGATHTRFAHSVGVFHTARQLAQCIKNQVGSNYNEDRAQVAMAAALVHDVGHGPFSHAFEAAATAFSEKKHHEDWTAEIVTGSTGVNRVLEGFRTGFSREVADLIIADTPADIYASIVSSQFDADRLDYLRRDRMMAGVLHGGFDFSWLLANLEVGPVPLTQDDEIIGEVEALILGQKALQAAESYVLGLFHLYFSVYFHKTTRGAEKMLTAMLKRIAELIRGEAGHLTGLSTSHPVYGFIQSGSLSDYLWLDDTSIWGSLADLSKARDRVVSYLATRLACRRLYKVVDVGAYLQAKGGEAAVAKFKMRLAEMQKAENLGPIDVFSDTARRNPYQRKGLETPDVLKKVLIRRSDGTNFEDLRDRSDVVKALEEKALFRVYVRDNSVRKKILSLVEGI